MIENLDYETYLYIYKDKYIIYLFDKKKNQTLYKDQLITESNNGSVDFDLLSKFLDRNIFKIEKKIDNFIKNIFIVLENDEILDLNFGIKKKNYTKEINKNDLENILRDAKELFEENNQNQIIMHIIIKNYIINEKKYNSFQNNLNSPNLGLEINIMSISENLSQKFNKVLEKYQIKINRFLNAYYIKKFYSSEIELPFLINKIIEGFNEHEVMIVKKSRENKGFFEKFFQLFS